MKIELEKFKIVGIEGVENNFKNSKEIAPICLILTGNQELRVFPIPTQNDDEKDFLSDVAIPEIIKKTEAIAIILINEAWMSAEDLAIDGVIAPSMDPNRKEIVMMNFETISSAAMFIWEIVREEGKDAYLKRTNNWGNSNSTFTGRYANLLTTSKPSQN